MVEVKNNEIAKKKEARNKNEKEDENENGIRFSYHMILTVLVIGFFN